MIICHETSLKQFCSNFAVYLQIFVNGMHVHVVKVVPNLFERRRPLSMMEDDCDDNTEDDPLKKNINELPDEVLEYIFTLVSPYKDLRGCMLVCKRWHETVKSKGRRRYS